MQGEMIDQIENNIENAAEWVHQGTEMMTRCVNIADQRVIGYR